MLDGDGARSCRAEPWLAAPIRMRMRAIPVRISVTEEVSIKTLAIVTQGRLPRCIAINSQVYPNHGCPVGRNAVTNHSVRRKPAIFAVITVRLRTK